MTETANDPAAETHPLLEGAIAGKLVRLALPGLLGGLMQSFLYVADGRFVGTLGPLPLAGVALVFPLFALSVMLSAGAVGGAVVAATARALGARDREGAGALVRTALILALLGGGISAVIVQLFGPAFFRLLGGEGEVLEAAIAYAGVLFPGIVVIWLFNMLASLLRGAGDMRRPAVALGIAATVHILSATVLVLGKGPIASLGIAGAALSLLLGYAAGGLYLAWRLFGPAGPDWVRFAGKIDWGQVLWVGRRGSFAGVQSVLTIAMALVVTAYMARIGPKALAGYGVGVRLELVIIPVIFAFGSACIAMAGVSLGAGERARAIRVAWTGSGFAAGFVGLIGCFLALFPALWSGLFTGDTEIAAATAQYLGIVGPAYTFFGLGLCLYFASQALNSLVWPVTGAGIRLAILLAGGAALLGEGIDARTIYLLVAAAMMAYGLFNALTLRLGPWRA
ncbi:MATE family efflux transporter [Nisaea acidiphila]|uniref:MATE family efflux transporter n=1 Tax=Nisaea acidiphila TaxID=1862145 RepID=A0A9J7ATL0_9PROT|nr:MATE family efflux transporter [Nisaea acidiphila]UUX49817.1 MATE family efflux transporter [Nisaea acidiphila]